MRSSTPMAMPIKPQPAAAFIKSYAAKNSVVIEYFALITKASFIGLLRKYAPKNKPLSTLTKKELNMSGNELNLQSLNRLVPKAFYIVFRQPLNYVLVRV
jgi:hypothetical protein